MGDRKGQGRFPAHKNSGQGALAPPVSRGGVSWLKRAGGGIRTRDLLLGKEAFYH